MRLLPLALLLTPSIAFAQLDGGTSTTADGGMSGCGSITFAGECQGDLVVFCDVENDEILMIDCDVEYGESAICAEIDAEYGVDCELANGEACLYQDENGDFGTSFCQGAGAGCVESADESVCQAAVGSCTEDDIGTCRGDLLVYDCNINQPWIVDCGGYGGTCDDDHCLVPGGSLCDDEVLVCAPGATCNAQGFCINDELADAGVPDSGAASPADSGVGGGNEKEEKDGCTCAARGARDLASPYLLVLVAAWFIVRRRER